MASSRREDWAESPLYLYMNEIFPSYRTVLGKFDVHRIARELGYSHEAVYKWFRKGTLSPQNANAIIDLALTDKNVMLLIENGTPRPEIRDFDQFVYRRTP